MKKEEKREPSTPVLEDSKGLLNKLRDILEELSLALYKNADVNKDEIIEVVETAEQVKEVVAIVHGELKEIQEELETWMITCEYHYGTSAKMHDMNTRIWDLGESIKSLEIVISKEYPKVKDVPYLPAKASDKITELFDDFIDELNDNLYESSASLEDAVNEIESLQGA